MPCHGPSGDEYALYFGRMHTPVLCGLCKLLTKHQIQSVEGAYRFYTEHLLFDMLGGDKFSQESARREFTRLDLRILTIHNNADRGFAHDEVYELDNRANRLRYNWDEESNKCFPGCEKCHKIPL